MEKKKEEDEQAKERMKVSYKDILQKNDDAEICLSVLVS